MTDDVSELRIRIARVLESWQCERQQLDDGPEHAMLGEHIAQIKAAVTPTPRTAQRFAGENVFHRRTVPA